MSDNVKKFIDGLNDKVKVMGDKVDALVTEMAEYSSFVDSTIDTLSDAEKEEMSIALDGEFPVMNECKEKFEKLREMME